MAWNGSGTFNRTNGANSGAQTWQDDENDGVGIVSDRHDSHDQDLAEGINNCLTKDGQNSPTANLDFNGFGITSLASITGSIMGSDANLVAGAAGKLVDAEKLLTYINIRLDTTGNLGNAARKNEGSGNGLDADTVDGIEGGSLALKSVTISAGGGLTGGGSLAGNRTISHADTSSQSSVNNSGLTFIQDVSLDGYGHVTNINSATVTPSNVNDGAGALTVGSYAILAHRSSTSSDAGDTASGNNLTASSCGARTTGAGVSGTWRCMGEAQGTEGDDSAATLWLRIS